jgi:putative membrane protein
MWGDEDGRYSDGGYGWGMHDGWGWGGWLMLTIMLVLLVTAIVVTVVLLLRTDPAARHGSGRETGDDGGGGGYLSPTARQQPTARQLLDERYARGELDDEEYVRRRELLRSGD